MKQKDLAYKIVQLAGGLADISMQNMDSKKTVDGLAVQLHNLDSVDEDVKSEAQDFKVARQLLPRFNSSHKNLSLMLDCLLPQPRRFLSPSWPLRTHRTVLRSQGVVETERTLAGVVQDVVTFVNGCSKLVKSADLTMTSGKAKVPPHSSSFPPTACSHFVSESAK